MPALKSEGWICLFKCLDQWKQVGGPAAQVSRQLGSSRKLFCDFSSKMLHRIVKLTVMDVRFPTSLEQHGSDAMVRKLQQQKLRT